MRDNWTYNRSGTGNQSGGRWPVGKTGRRAKRLTYPKMDVLELGVIERLTNIRGNDGELRIWYFRPRTQKVARCMVFNADATYESLRAHVRAALAGSQYQLLGVSREYNYGWPWFIEVVKAQETAPCADSPFSAGTAAPVPATSGSGVATDATSSSSLLVAGAESGTAPAGV